MNPLDEMSLEERYTYCNSRMALVMALPHLTIPVLALVLITRGMPDFAATHDLAIRIGFVIWCLLAVVIGFLTSFAYLQQKDGLKLNGERLVK